MLFCLPVTPCAQLVPLDHLQRATKQNEQTNNSNTRVFCSLTLVLTRVYMKLSSGVWCWVPVFELSNSSNSLNMYLWCKQSFTHASGMYWIRNVGDPKAACWAWRAHSISNSTHHPQNTFVFYVMMNIKHVTVCCSCSKCRLVFTLFWPSGDLEERKLDLSSINHCQTSVYSMRRLVCSGNLHWGRN